MTPLLAQRSRVDRQFERLYQRHAPDVYRYALAVLRNPSDAEDVTQTTFLNAYRAFSGGDRPETPKNWLIAIAHNVCRQRFRQAARRPSEVVLNEDLAEAFVPDEHAIGAEDIQRALGHLAFNQRAALVMRELEGRSYAEIAEILGVSVAAVETLIFRARRALREQLEGALTCGETELAISRQADGLLSRAEKGPLRAHLRECKSCATLARRLRAQRTAWKALAAVPLPGTLSGLFGGSGATATVGVGGGALAVKAAAVAVTAVIATGTVVEGKKLVVDKHASTTAAPTSVAPGASGSAPSAKAYAPGQVKPDGQRATKPEIPPGQAKKPQGVPTALKPGRPSPGPNPDAPGQVEKTTSSETVDTTARNRAAAARAHQKVHPRKKPARKKPAAQPRPQPQPPPKSAGGADSSAKGNAAAK